VQLITEQEHPNIHKAFRYILYDMGAANESVDSFPTKEECSLPAVDKALGDLCEQDFETLCCGERDDQLAIAHSSAELMAAHALLEEFWESVN
jgi:hypothetical protein